MKFIQRQDAPLLWADPEQIVRRGILGHREDAGPVGPDDEVGAEFEIERIALAGHAGNMGRRGRGGKRQLAASSSSHSLPSAVIARFMPRLSGLVLMDRLHGVDSTRFRALAGVLGHEKGSTPCVTTIAFCTDF